MTGIITNFPAKNAALVVGVAFIASVFIVTLIDDFLLANFVIPGDTAALANDIKANPQAFGFAIVGYLIVLLLDTIIGLALYVVLSPANKKLALLSGALRIVYAAIVAMGLIGLLFQVVDVYGYASLKLIGYLFFAGHLMALGFSILKSGYIPKVLGMFLMIASLTYTVFFFELSFTTAVTVLIMLIMAGAELALSLWLIFQRKTLPDIES